MSKRDGKDWRLGYVGIEEVIKAEFLTALIAVESKVSVTLSGKPPVSYQGPPVAQLDLRNFSPTKNQSAVAHYQVSDVTPLFRPYRVKDPVTEKAFHTEYK